MEYLLTAIFVLFVVYLTGKCKQWLRLKWLKLWLMQEKLVLVLRIYNLEEQIEGLIRELDSWRRFRAPQVELVIIDLDSTDASKTILEKLNGKQSSFHLLSLDNYNLNGLSMLDVKISELVFLDLSGESDYGKNLHKLKKVLANISPVVRRLEHQI